MAETKYTIVSDEPEIDGKIVVRRLSDNLVARCKPTWLRQCGNQNVWIARSKTKADRMIGLDWEKEV